MIQERRWRRAVTTRMAGALVKRRYGGNQRTQALLRGRVQGEIQRRFNQLDFVNQKRAARVNQTINAGIKRRDRQSRQHRFGAL